MSLLNVLIYSTPALRNKFLKNTAFLSYVNRNRSLGDTELVYVYVYDIYGLLRIMAIV